MYLVVCEKINVKKEFASYNDARKFMTETKHSWENIIDKLNYFDERREFYCDLYFSIKIVKQ